jgi:hypothetical protein
MNIAIVRAFISSRQLAIQHRDLEVRLEQLRKEMQGRFGEHDSQLGSILNNEKLKRGDIFLFFGWFKETNEFPKYGQYHSHYTIETE